MLSPGESYLFQVDLLRCMQKKKNDDVKTVLKLTLKKNGKVVDAEVEIPTDTFNDLWMKYVTV